MKMCMGRPENERQCQLCKRLPQTPEDEEAPTWLNHTTMRVPCVAYRKAKDAVVGVGRALVRMP